MKERRDKHLKLMRSKYLHGPCALVSNNSHTGRASIYMDHQLHAFVFNKAIDEVSINIKRNFQHISQLISTPMTSLEKSHY